MATGRGNKLVGQTGEYLVAAELSRRGLITTTFTGNVPHYDIIASDESGRHVSVQVKASRGDSWQFGNIRDFCDIKFIDNRQVIGKPAPSPVKRLVLVLVRIAECRLDDEFYICTWLQLRELLINAHAAYLDKHGGVRPKRWDSLHCALKEQRLRQYRDNWEVVTKTLR